MEKLLEKYIEFFVKEAAPLPKIRVQTPKIKTLPKQLELFQSKAPGHISPKTTPAQASLMTKIFQGIKFDKTGKPIFPEEYWSLSPGAKFKLLQTAYRKRAIKQKIERKKNFAKLTQKYTRRVQGAILNRAVKIFQSINPLNFTAKKAIATAIGLAMLYKYFSGKSPSGSGKETSKIVSDVSSISDKIPVNNIMQLIGEARSNTEDPEVLNMLNDISKALEVVAKSSLNLDNPSNALTYSELMKNLELAASTFLASDYSNEFQQLSLVLSEVVFTINDARSSVASMMQQSTKESSYKLDELYSYSDYYYGIIVKNAWLGVATTVAFILVPLIANYISNSASQITEIKDVLKELSELMKDQLEGSWFTEEEKTKKYAPIFKSYNEDLIGAIKLIDQMLNPPKGSDDTSQIVNIDKFIKSAENILIKSTEVSGALTEMQSVVSKAGTFLSGLGFNITDLSKFNSKIGKISGSLSLFVNKLKKDKEALELKAQQQAVEIGKTESTPVSDDFYKNMADIEL